MTWTTRYDPPNTKHWQGRNDSPNASCFFQIIQLANLNDQLPASKGNLAFGLIGFCSDEGVRRNLGRPGAAEGPDVIRNALAKLPVQKQNFLCYDVGNISCTDGDLENAQTALGEVVHQLLEAGIIPIVIGGGHELAWGNYQGITKKYINEHIGIINFDSHFDMRPLLPSGDGSSGTSFLQMALAHQSSKRKFDYSCIGIQHAGNIRQLFETAKKNNVQIILADDFHQGFMDKCVNFVDNIIDQNHIIYLSLCLDVFAAPFAPGVSAPQILGLLPWQIIPLVRQLAASGKVISYDIAEFSPRLDIDNRTANLAANFIYEIIHHHAHTIGTYHGNNPTT